MRILDKLDKVGVSGVVEELSPVIGKNEGKKLLDVVSIEGSNEQKIASLSSYDTSEISEFIKLAVAYGVNEKSLCFDPSLARGLDYYTGIIFEVFIPEVSIGAVCAGGRYDDLCSMFCAEQFSGVGVAFGFDRTIVAMEEMGLLADVGLNSQVLVTYFNENTIVDSLQIVRNLQKVGINTEVYFEPTKMAKQIKYADKKNIPFVIIYGEDEKKNKTATIKRMSDGEQKVVPLPQVVSYLKNYYV
jgi:histidyl-tRNA synthetase